MNWTEGKYFEVSPGDEVKCAVDVQMYNKLPENEKQYALSLISPVVGNHQKWKTAVWSSI